MADSSSRIKIPEAISKYIKKDAPKDARMMAAKGVLPMAPAVQLTVLTFLLGDGDSEVAGEAEKSLLAMPENIVKNLLKEPIHPKTLDFFAKNRSEKQEILEIILLNKSTSDDSFVRLAEKASGKALDIIAENQERMMRTPQIANGLKKNPNLPKSTMDRIVSFLRMSGIQVEGESPLLTHEEVNKLIKETEKQLQDAKTAFEKKLKQMAAGPAAPKAATGEGTDEDEEDFYESEDESGQDWEDSGGFGDEFEGSDDLFEEKENASEEEQKGIAAKIAVMTVPQKVKIALLGNKEVRAILIKDPNKIVSTAVIKSPKLTDNEVHGIAQMRSINDEIIRFIANNNDWTKNYSIKLALCNNPKAPVPIAVKFLRYLNAKDLGDLSRNKNVSPQIQKIAKDAYNKSRGIG